MSQIPIEELPVLHDVFRARYEEMYLRHQEISHVIDGDLHLVDPDEDKLDLVSANMIQVAIEDTAEAAAIVPTIRVVPENSTDKAKSSAAEMERIGVHYLDVSNFELLLPQTLARIIAYGLCPWVVWPDTEQNVPVIELRDPRGCYPEPGMRPGDLARRVMFTRELYFSQLPKIHQAKIIVASGENEGLKTAWQKNQKVTIVEMFTEHELLVGAILQSGNNYIGYDGQVHTTGAGETGVARIPVELERIENPTGVCQAFIGARPTIDGQFRGQFDQVIGPQRAHARLQALLLDYADQAVYSDIWVKDIIGEVSFGGGSYIRLGPQGAIGRVPPAVSALNVNQDLALLEEAVHLGGRWPKSRPGEIDQSIASAKFLEASAGMMNTVIKTLHLVVKDMLQKALTFMFHIDASELMGEGKTMAGILRNQEFLDEYDTANINVNNRVKVEYGLGLGKDASQSAVLHIQYAAQGFLSKKFVMESIEGLTDVQREESRLDVETFRDIALTKILQGTQDGSVSNEQILQLAQKREEGVPLFDLFEEFIVKPEQEAAAAGPGLLSGLTGQALGGALGPGPPGGGQPPQPGVPPRPEPAELLARLGSPAGPPGSGSNLGTQVGGGGPTAPVPAGAA